MRKIAIITVIFLTIIFPTHLFSQSSSNKIDKKQYKFNEDFSPNIFKDSARILSSPIDWEENDWLRFGLMVGSGYFLFKNDEKIRNWVLSHKNQTSDDISHLVKYLGNGYFLTGLLGSVYLIGEISNENSFRKTAVLGFESLLISGAIVHGIKIISGRMRPSASEKANQFYPFHFNSKYYSFPSGHSAAAFAIAAVITEQSESLIVDVVVLTLASLVALSRVNDNLHWTSDVFLGSAIGYFVGKKLAKYHSNKVTSSFKISMSFSKNKTSFSIIYFF